MNATESFYRPKPPYRVGQANDPQPEDKFYNDLQAARVRAGAMADCDFNRPVAIWNAADQIVRLFLCGQEFEARCDACGGLGTPAGEAAGLVCGACNGGGVLI